MDTVWGLDIGGTKTALVIGDREGSILGRWQVATETYGGNWKKLLDELLEKPGTEFPQPLAVGISCGGPLDSKRGVILSPPNLPGWDRVPITAYLKNKMGVPVFLQNDANACALAEWRFGAGKGCKNMIFLTFGTGMGAGLILNGHLYAGANDMAGEVGHIRLSPDGPVGFGKRGSFESFCSGGGLSRLAQQRLGRAFTAKELAEKADRGDSDAARVLWESAGKLGQALALLVDILNPERIIIGSIYARAEHWFRDTMLQALREEALEQSLVCCQIRAARLGERLGDVAALSVAWNGMGEERI